MIWPFCRVISISAIDMLIFLLSGTTPTPELYHLKKGYSMNYSDRFRQIILERHMSQAEFAKAANCSEASMSRYLSGASSMPPVSVFVSLAQTLGVSIDFLLGFTRIPHPRTSDEEFGYIMYDCYSRATDRDKLLVGTILNSYLTEEEVTMQYDLR